LGKSGLINWEISAFWIVGEKKQININPKGRRQINHQG